LEADRSDEVAVQKLLKAIRQPIGSTQDRLTLPCGNWVGQSVCEPELDERLTRYAHPARFPIQGIYHPSGKINVYALRIGTDPPGLADLELICDSLAGIKICDQMSSLS